MCTIMAVTGNCVSPEESEKAFASERKSLIGITDRIMPFPPGHYWKNGKAAMSTIRQQEYFPTMVPAEYRRNKKWIIVFR